MNASAWQILKAMYNHSKHYLSLLKAVCCITKKEWSDSTEKKLKRRHECTGRRMRKTPAPRKKRVKTLQSKGSCSREQHLDVDSDSQSSFTSESEDENAFCPADNCMEPEGDEVGFLFFFPFVSPFNDRMALFYFKFISIREISSLQILRS